MEEIGVKFTKVCIKCNKEKTIDNYRISRKSTGCRRTACRSCEREISRRNTFKIIRGISHEERDLLLLKQGSKCKCCGKTTNGSKKGWHVDHDHSTNIIRGILCANCNIALGQVKDNIEHLKLLIMYLEKDYGSNSNKSKKEEQ